MAKAEYFGTVAQQALQWRAERLWHVFKDDPQFSSHGRTIALAGYSENNLSTQIALTELLGVCAVEGVDNASASFRQSELEAAGLVTDMYRDWSGGREVVDAALSILNRRSLPDDLTVLETGPKTSPDDLKKLDALTQSCDVMLPMGSFLRGAQMPSVFLYAQDNEGRVVGASGTVAQFHPKSAKAGKVWWGMLATDESRRGEGIAVLLGAVAIRSMNEKFGYSQFFTGVREGNRPSEALCTKLCLAPRGEIDLIAIYPPAFEGGQLTK